MNLAYKHLDTKLRFAELTIGQWLGVLFGLLLAVLWGFYLSPFGLYITLLSSIYLAGIPVGAALLASATEFNAWLLLRSAIRWRRMDARFTPGPGSGSRGYRIQADPDDDTARTARRTESELDLASLWEAI